MGLSCELEHLFSFIYKAIVENELIEYEYDHVFAGYTDVIPKPNILEVQNYKWIAPEALLYQVSKYPQNFTYWFKMALEKVMKSFADAAEWIKFKPCEIYEPGFSLMPVSSVLSTRLISVGGSVNGSGVPGSVIFFLLGLNIL